MTSQSFFDWNTRNFRLKMYHSKKSRSRNSVGRLISNGFEFQILKHVNSRVCDFKVFEFELFGFRPKNNVFLVLFQGPLYEQEVYGDGMNSRLFMNIHDSHVSQAELTWPLRRVLCRVQAKQNSRPKISNINLTQIVQNGCFRWKLKCGAKLDYIIRVIIESRTVFPRILCRK